MYNRYTPQEDGSFRKSRIPDSGAPQVRREAPPPPEMPELQMQPPPPASPHTEGLGIREFLHRLLPQGLDIEDLIVILLLLLMQEDDGRDGNQALLTLGAYLFL